MPAEYLNPQQTVFLNLYLETGLAKQSAIAAGYAPNSASAEAARILNLPVSKRMVKEANDQAAESLGITALKVLKELSEIAFAKPGTKIEVDEDGSKDVSLDSFENSEINVTTTSSGGKKAKITTVKTIKNSDKINALNLLMKHKGMLQEKVEVEHKGSLLELIEQSYKLDDKKEISAD